MAHITSESPLSRRMQHHWSLTFVLMVISFLVFGAASINLAQTFLLNVRLIQEHGTLVLWDGALLQLLEILLSAAFSVSFYLLFKTCEAVLLQKLLADPHRE